MDFGAFKFRGAAAAGLVGINGCVSLFVDVVGPFGE